MLKKELASFLEDELAFVAAEPNALAEHIITVLFSLERRNDLHVREHLVTRLESVIADWITAGNLEYLAELSKRTAEQGRAYRRSLFAAPRLEASHLLGLQAMHLIEFVQHFTSNASVPRAHAYLATAKRRRWVTGLCAIACQQGPWSPEDFRKASGLSKGQAYSALKEMVGIGILANGSARGARELTPLGLSVVRRLQVGRPKKMEEETTARATEAVAADNDQVICNAIKERVPNPRLPKCASQTREAASSGPVKPENFQDPEFDALFQKLVRRLDQYPA